MTEIGFYHLTRTPLDRALPKILEKALEAGKRAIVIAGSDERVAVLNAALWTYDQGSFLPHGTVREGEAARQPVWLTAEDENPNGAQIVVLTDGATVSEMAAFERCLDMFDGNDPAAVAAARDRWRAAKAAGHALTYWQQTDGGGWAKKDV
ncbi:MAG: DNA polymerase III subunit chi [Alphaproteobacteria bacterium]|nr:DNA polymerase III subunit chi [Alphaproteobacteria bacterium]